jgi:transketolase
MSESYQPGQAWDYRDTLRELGEQESNVLVLDAGLSTSMRTESFRATFPQRYFNLGIAEQHAVGVAAGLAHRGFVPILHSFANFLTRRAHDQIALSIAWPELKVILVGGACGVFDARNGPSHTGVDDLSTMAALPGVFVAEPGDGLTTRDLLRAAARGSGPAYIRLRRFGVVPDLLVDARRTDGTVQLRVPSQARCTLVGAGAMLAETCKAADLLAAEDIAVDLLHTWILQPFETGPLLESAHRTGLVITVENHMPAGGFGDAVARALGPHGIRCERFGLPREFLPAADPDWQLSHCRLDAKSIATRVAEVLSVRRH